jgi:hypothetical protein
LNFCLLQTDPAVGSATLLLRKARQPGPPPRVETFAVDDNREFAWVEPLQKLVAHKLSHPEDPVRICITARQNPDSGAEALTRCIKYLFFCYIFAWKEKKKESH